MLTKRVGLLLLLLLLSGVASAQVPTKYIWLTPTAPFTCNAMQEGAIYQNTTSHILFVCNGSVWTNSGFPDITDDGTTVTVNTASTFRATPLANGGFQNVTGTLPLAGGGNGIYGIFLGITTPTSAAAAVRYGAVVGNLNAGYTGSASTYGAFFLNNAAAAPTISWASYDGGNYGGAFSTTTGPNASLNVGVLGVGGNANASGYAVGVLGSSPIGGTAPINRIGGLFSALGSGSGDMAIYASMGVGVPATVNAVIVSDNKASAKPTYMALQNGTKVWSIENNGSQWAAQTKTLTDAAAAVAFATVTLPSGSVTGGQIDYCIEVVDATPNYQNRCGGLVYTAVNKAGTLTITCVRPGGSATLDNTTDFLASSSGTMTDTFTCVDGTGGVLQFKVTADSSLTPTTERINYAVRQWGNAAVAFTPQ
jgi:hypothetical protein